MYKRLFLPLIGMAVIASCNNPTTGEEVITEDTSSSAVTTEVPTDAPETYEKDGLKIYPLEGSPTFEDAKLTRNFPKDDHVAADGKVKMGFSVEGYELGAQTSDAAEKGIANSGKGQHIHIIVDNSPYTAHYMPNMEMSFEPGNHIILAFLSRSYHESVKSKDAYTVFQFAAGEETAETEKVDLSQPMLFYSRPKGEYKGEDTKKILFDFYLHNAELKADGYSVMVTVNDSQFEFDTWQPYIIEGLPMGENTISIKLVDADGNDVGGELNQVTRTFTLSE